MATPPRTVPLIAPRPEGEAGGVCSLRDVSPGSGEVFVSELRMLVTVRGPQGPFFSRDAANAAASADLPAGWCCVFAPACPSNRDDVEEWLAFAVWICSALHVPRGIRRAFVSHAFMLVASMPGNPPVPTGTLDERGCLDTLRNVLAWAQRREKLRGRPRANNAKIDAQVKCVLDNDYYKGKSPEEKAKAAGVTPKELKLADQRRRRRKSYANKQRRNRK